MLVTTRWSVKERIHLLEVRIILDTIAIMAVVFIILFFLTLEKKNLSAQAKLNIFITSGLIILIPFFKVFWKGVFHPLLFANMLWLNTPKDVSFYIMPGVFFKYSMIFFIFATVVINGAIWFYSRRKKYTLTVSIDQDLTEI